MPSRRTFLASPGQYYYVGTVSETCEHTCPEFFLEASKTIAIYTLSSPDMSPNYELMPTYYEFIDIAKNLLILPTFNISITLLYLKLAMNRQLA
jgi:hypothetical protein